MNKKLLLLFFAIATCGIMVNAATNYNINVGGVEVNSDNKNNVTGGNIASGTVTYNSDTKTLTLTSVSITRTTSDDYAVHNRGCEGLTIVFNGTSNLTSTQAHGIKLDKSTTLYVSSGATVNVNSGKGSALYLGNIQVWFDGSGTINFKTTQGSTNACIKGGSTTEAIFDGAHVTAKSYNYYAMEMLVNTFHAGTDLRLYYNGVKQQVYNCVLQNMISPAKGAPAILEPYGAYVNTTARTTIYTSSGAPVTSSDIYISDNYEAILNSSYFPDANFRSYLFGLYSKGYITSSDVSSRTSMSPSGKSISNLEGIQYFKQLAELNCSNNNLTELSLMGLTKLTTLNCSNNVLTKLYFNGNGNLTSLDCHNNLLTGFYNGLPDNLQYVNVSNNKFTTLSVCNRSYLTTLDASNNLNMTRLECYSNALTSLNVSGCSALTYISCSGNKFTTLSITNFSSLKTLNIQNNKNLTTLNCSNNALTSLDFYLCSSLATINCSSNQLTSLDVSALNNLTNLNCRTNKLTSLNVSNKTKLTQLEAQYNQLASINVQGCSSLNYLMLESNKLSSLSVQGCNALRTINCCLNKFSASGANTLINSLCTIPAGSQGALRYIYPGYSTGSYVENNVSLTNAQVQTARNKRWYPKQFGSNGWVDIPVSIPGDVNGDGYVSSVDVTALYNYLLNGDDSELVNGDQDGDGHISSVDITVVYNIMLGN